MPQAGVVQITKMEQEQRMARLKELPQVYLQGVTQHDRRLFCKTESQPAVK
jgi:hypothetical protein